MWKFKHIWGHEEEQEHWYITVGKTLYILIQQSEKHITTQHNVKQSNTTVNYQQLLCVIKMKWLILKWTVQNKGNQYLTNSYFEEYLYLGCKTIAEKYVKCHDCLSLMKKDIQLHFPVIENRKMCTRVRQSQFMALTCPDSHELLWKEEINHPCECGS